MAVRKSTYELIDKFEKNGVVFPKIEFDNSTFKKIRFSWKTTYDHVVKDAYANNQTGEYISTSVTQSPFHSYYFKYDEELKGMWMIPIMTSHDESKRSTCEKTRWIEDLGRAKIFISNEKDVIQCMSRYNWDTEKFEGGKWFPATISFWMKPVLAQNSDYLYKEFTRCFGDMLVISKTGMAINKDDFGMSSSGYWGSQYRIEQYLKTRDRKVSEKTIKKNNEIAKTVESETNDDFDVENGFMMDYNNGVLYIRMISNGAEYGRLIPNTKNGELIYLYKTNKGWTKKPMPDLSCSIKQFVINKRCNNSDFKYSQEFVKEFSKYKNNHASRRSYYVDPSCENAYDIFNFVKELIKSPILESVLKISSENLKNRIFEETGDIGQIYKMHSSEKFDMSKTSLFGKLGINKYQFSTDENGSAIRFAKLLYDTTDISFIDNVSWDRILKIKEKAKVLPDPHRYYWRGSGRDDFDILVRGYDVISVVDKLSNINNVKRDISLIEKIMKYVESEETYRVTIPGNNYWNHTVTRNAMEEYSDYIKMLAQMKYAVNNGNKEYEEILNSFELFPEVDEVVTLHNRAIEFSGGVKQKVDVINWDKAIKRLKKNEYSTEKYSIIAPTKSNELSREGQIQNICIGSYIDSVMDGRSDIYFIRKNEDKNTPYFAIEVRNSSVQQIHGKGNRWLGSIKDEEEFNEVIQLIAEWLTKFKINCNKHILANSSNSYGSYNSTDRKLPDIESVNKAKEKGFIIM